MKAMKKSILTFLAFALVFTMAMPAFAANVATGAQYSDIENADVADAVKVLSSLEVLQGYPDGTFKPDNSITRAEFAAVVVRLLGYEKAAQAAVGPTQFKDEVLPWASGYVNIAVQQNLLTGYPDGTFRANQPVTQAEALTILVRALGYKALADKQGQWPYNYIVMADSVGLTEDLDGVVANQPANRGFVALASEAALTVPKAIASGFTINGEVNYVVSGTQGTKEQTILANDLKYASQKAIVTDIPRVNSKLAKDEIKIVYKDADDKNVTKTVTVPAGFDFEKAFGAETTLYLDGSDVVYAKADSVIYDAVDAAKKADNKVKLVDADKTYEFADNVEVYIDGKSKDVEDLDAVKYDYAKVALDKNDDIRFIEVYDWTDYLVVEETKDNVVYSYGETLDVKKFAIVKEGKTVQTDSLEKGDILFYSENAKFAEVYNETVNGEISKVFVDGIKVADETYDFLGTFGNAQYLDDDTLKEINKDIATSMKDEGEVTLFLDRLGELVFVAGDLGKVKTSDIYVLLTEKVINYDSKGRTYLAVEGVKPDGKTGEYSLNSKAIEKSGLTASSFPTSLTTGASVEGFAKEDIIKVVVDEDEDVVKIEKLSVIPNSTADYKVTSTYADGKKLNNNAVVFMKDGDDYEAFTWADAEEYFGKVTESDIYYDSNARVIAIYVQDSDADATYKERLAYVTDVRPLANDEDFLTTVIIGTTEYEFVLTSELTEDEVYILEVNEEMDDAKPGDLQSGTPGVVNGKPNLRNNTFMVEGNEVPYELVSDSYIYDVDADKKISLRDLADEDNVTIYSVLTADARFVQFLFVDKVDNPGDATYTLEDVALTTGNTVSVKVTIDNGSASTDYTVRVIDEDGSLVTYSNVIHTNPDGDYTGVVTATIGSSFKAGVYTLELVKVSDPSTVLKTVSKLLLNN